MAGKIFTFKDSSLGATKYSTIYFCKKHIGQIQYNLASNAFIIYLFVKNDNKLETIKFNKPFETIQQAKDLLNLHIKYILSTYAF